MTTERMAQCSCGALRIRCSGEPMRRSVCHCEACRRRTGSAFAFNVTFEADQVAPGGDERVYVRKADSGRTCTFHFCPACGATVYYTIEVRPGRVTVPGGAFGTPNSFEPTVSVYNHRRESWVAITPSCDLVEE